MMKTTEPFFEKTPNGQLFRIETFGCRLNFAESDIIREQLYQSENCQDQNIIILNSCAVTAQAERQLHQRIRHLRHHHPNARILVTGCAAQINPKQFNNVDGVIANSKKLSSFSTLDRDHTQTEPDDIMSKNQTVLPVKIRPRGRHRVFIPIQNGCDHRCTFCIIPFGRGNSRSASAEEVASMISNSVAEGYHEAVLTGVDITSWGQDLPGQPPLGSLVKYILDKVPNLLRLRLSSLDCCEIDPELISLYRDQERLMPHLHLSLQSGDDMILKRMKRRHSRKDAVSLCQSLRRARPDIVLGADIIAGFPTETEEMFENSVTLIEECNLTHLHIFPFSARYETPAARMPALAPKIIKQRAGILRSIGEKSMGDYLKTQIGKKQHILVETSRGGYNEHYIPFRFDPEIIPNNNYPVIDAIATDYKDRLLFGKSA